MVSEKRQHSIDEQAYYDEHPRQSVMKLRDEPYLRRRIDRREEIIELGYCRVPPAMWKVYEGMGYFRYDNPPEGWELVLTEKMPVRGVTILMLVEKERQKEIQEMGTSGGMGTQRWPKEVRALVDPKLSEELRVT